jgi:hypothetical protein
VNGDALCAGQGFQCRACNGPIGPTNPLGLPIGYNTHGLPDLDLVTGLRLSVIAGVSASVRIPLILVGTTGRAGAEFRDLPGEGGSALDLADLGATIPGFPVLAPGIGAGGTFANGVTLPIGEPCCATGAPVLWGPEQPGVLAAGSTFRRTFDAGPGPDGIPSCLGDNGGTTNGAQACNTRLGKGISGAKTDGLNNTGLDDVPRAFPIGSSGTIPASESRFLAPVVSGPSSSCEPLPTALTGAFNLVSAAAFRDIAILIPRGTDGLLKLDVTHCPIVGGVATCAAAPDVDGDGVIDSADNCPFSPNLDQLDTDSDGVGNACDNCLNHANPRTSLSATGVWATLTGCQRDDDHDGYGNRCDAKFVGTGLVGSGDLAEFRASTNKNRAADVCGTTGGRPCAIFDLSEADTLIGGGDLAIFRTLNNKLPGPKCASCPLPCVAGTAGSCF